MLGKAPSHQQAEVNTPSEPPSERRPDRDRPGGDETSERGEGEPTTSPSDAPARVPPPPDAIGGMGPRIDDADRWGDLPPHARRYFRAEGGGPLPPQYRDWIDLYYRRLNRSP